MFPIHCVVESVRGAECPNCSDGGDILIDSYAIVSGHTPLSQLVDTVLMALGCSHLSLDAKGKIQVKSWKPLAFKDITENIEQSVEELLKDISNHLTLRIATKVTEPTINGGGNELLAEMKEKLLKSLISQSPSPIASVQDAQLKNFLERLICGDQLPDDHMVDAQLLVKFNDWCSRLGQTATVGPTNTSPATTKFHSLVELPKLQRWFRDSPNPSRRKLLSHLHILNSSNYRRHNPKLNYQQICNFFATARAIHRKTAGRQTNNLATTTTAVAGCSPPSISVSDSSANVSFTAEISPHSHDADKTDSAELPTPFDRSPSSTNSSAPHSCDLKAEPLDEAEMLLVKTDISGGISNSSRTAGESPYRARSRLMFDPITELPALKRWFDDTPHPSWLQIDRFTDTLNAMPYRQTYPAVTSHNVKIWFKNRRAKNKRTNGQTAGILDETMA